MNRPKGAVLPQNLFCFIFLFLIGCGSLFSQEEEFDKIYYKTLSDYVFSHPNKAYFIADSLYKTSENDNQRIRALMLKANVYLSKSDLKSARDVATEADLLAAKAKDYNWQFRAKAFIVDIYQKIQFMSEGMKILNEMDKIIPKEKKPPQRANMSLITLHAKANLLRNQIDSDSLLYYLNQSEQYYSSVEKLDEGPMIIAISEHKIALVYYQKDDFERSLIHFQNTLKALEKCKNPNYHLYAYLYAGLGGIAYKHQQDTLEARENFNNVLDLMERNPSLRNRKFLLREVRDYYRYVDECEKCSEFGALLDASSRNSERKRFELAKDFYDEIHQNSKTTKSKLKIFYILSIGLVLILIIVVWKVIKSERKKKPVVLFYHTPTEKSRRKDK